MNLQIAQKIAKSYLIADILKYMENPYPYVTNVPREQQSELARQLDRLYQGNKDLMQGHYFATTKNFLKLNVDDYIAHYYFQAWQKIPESTYLRNYFKKK
jgi:hypothetical protein